MVTWHMYFYQLHLKHYTENIKKIFTPPSPPLIRNFTWDRTWESKLWTVTVREQSPLLSRQRHHVSISRTSLGTSRPDPTCVPCVSTTHLRRIVASSTWGIESFRRQQKGSREGRIEIVDDRWVSDLNDRSWEILEGGLCLHFTQGRFPYTFLNVRDYRDLCSYLDHCRRALP